LEAINPLKISGVIRSFARKSCANDSSIISEKPYQFRWNDKASSLAALAEYGPKREVHSASDDALLLQLPGNTVGWPGEAAQ
jgi:hypothetical protein